MAKVVAYPSGCYGSWINWMIHYLHYPDQNLSVPESNTGNSHNWNFELEESGLHLGFWRSWDQTRQLKDNIIYQIHPCQHKDDILIDNLNDIIRTFDKVVYPYADDSNIYWALNNRIDKIYLEQRSWSDWLNPNFVPDSDNIDDFREFVFPNHKDLLNSWPKNKQGLLDQWAQREYLSFVLKDVIRLSLGIDQLADIEKLNVFMVNINDLRDNFEATFINIMNYLELPINRNIDYEQVYKEWSKKQHHMYKDQLIHNIVDSVLNDTLFDWSELTLADEAIIQCILREKGYELKCHGLNDFPTNSKKLRELIYAT